jgi:DNA-binding SARP family transcriptional activator/tetratricopeptide (TPR) repeat protein
VLRDLFAWLRGERGVRIQILGPVEVFAAEGPVHLARRQQRLILGILAIKANRVVSGDRLIDLIWRDRPPKQARAVIQTRVSELKTALAEYFGDRLPLMSRGSGYVLAVESDLVDAHHFRRLVERARGADSPEQARGLLRKALNSWHGPMLGGWLPGDSHAALCGGFEASRLTAAEYLLELEIGSSERIAAVDDLRELVEANPTRERLTALAMSALHRAGRTAEALHLFDRCRRWLADELGVDPGAELQSTYLTIVRGDGGAPAVDIQLSADPGENCAVRRPAARQTHAGSAGAFRVVAPHLLPADIPDFTGRTNEAAALRQVLVSDRSGARLAVVSGPGGVGKTALCVRVAHGMHDRFSGGELYVDLHGFDRPMALKPYDVLARFLRALGVESALPETLDERAELYRHLVAGREIVVVLDNARDVDQVRPLLPGSPSCAVVITSRSRLAAAVGGTPIDLDVLSASQAVELISRMAGNARIGREPSAALALVDLCGRLPLAVRIAAARLVSKPHWSVQHLVDRLSDERRRLDHLSYGDLDVRASIALSYDGLGAEARLLLCLLGDIDLPEVNVWTSAALLDQHPVDAEEVLEQLHDAQLIDVAGREAGGYSRYRLHDLVRLFARERVELELTSADREAGRGRAFGAWLYLVESAYGRVYGDGSENVRSPANRHVVDERLADILTADPLAWFDIDREVVIAMIRRAAEEGRAEACWGMACTSASLFEMRRYFDDCRRILDTAMDVVTATGDSLGRAAVLRCLATLSGNRNDNEQANERLKEAAALFEQLRDRHGWALAALQLAVIYRHQNRNDAATALLQRAVAGLRDGGDRGGEAFGLRSIAQARLAEGSLAEADALLDQALKLARQGRSRRREAQILFYQGMLRLEQRRSRAAEQMFLEVLVLARELKDRPGEIQAHRGLALCHESNGDLGRAEMTLLAALELARQPDPTLLERMVLDELSRLSNIGSRKVS